MSRVTRKSSSRFRARSDTNWAVQPQKMAERLEISDLRSRGIVLSMYRCSEYKGADQLHGYRLVDLRLCFSHMQKAGFLMAWLKRKGVHNS